jgi:uncharacterized protein YjiS (DUF1127 family)
MIVLSSALSVSRATLGNLRRVAGAGLVRVGKLVRTLRNRHAVRQLAELDDHALKDIGLTRNDVQGALGASLLSDPSLILGDIAGMDHGRATRAATHAARRPAAIAPLQAEEPALPGKARGLSAAA